MVKSTWKQALGRLCIPQRYVLGIMGLTGMANAYIMRACLSIAITEMVSSDPVTDEDNKVYNDPFACPINPSHNSARRNGTSGEFDWSEKTQGMILSAFYYGYIITHVPGGLLAQKFGGKQTLGLGIFSTALFTLLTPVVARMGSLPLIILRFLMGLGEGMTFPALSTLLAAWAPPLERSKLASLCFAGVQLGMVIASALGGIIIQFVPGGWPNVFYIFGVVGVVWYVLWCLLCYNDPSSHPFITDEEKDYLAQTLGQTERSKDLGGTPWKAMLSSAPLWALIIGEVGHDWGLYTMITDLPKYMGDVMHFNIAENGILSALPYVTMWITSLLCGVCADWILMHKYMTTTTLRKLLATIGAVGPGAGVVLASYAGCDKATVATLFAVGMGLMGFCYSSLRVNALDLSPNFAGSIMALVNGSGSLSGMFAPYVIGVLTPHRSLIEWRVVFWIMFATLVISNFVFVLFGSGSLQPWNEPQRPAASPEDSEKKSTGSEVTIPNEERIAEKFLMSD